MKCMPHPSCIPAADPPNLQNLCKMNRHVCSHLRIKGHIVSMGRHVESSSGVPKRSLHGEHWIVDLAALSKQDRVATIQGIHDRSQLPRSGCSSYVEKDDSILLTWQKPAGYTSVLSWLLLAIPAQSKGWVLDQGSHGRVAKRPAAQVAALAADTALASRRMQRRRPASAKEPGGGALAEVPEGYPEVQTPAFSPAVEEAGDVEELEEEEQDVLVSASAPADTLTISASKAGSSPLRFEAARLPYLLAIRRSQQPAPGLQELFNKAFACTNMCSKAGTYAIFREGVCSEGGAAVPAAFES